jgi:hypothetical protein
MVKHGLLLVAVGSLGLCLSVSAQQTRSKPLVPLRGTDALALNQQGIFKTVDSSALIHELPMLTLLNGQSLPVSTPMGRMGMEQLNLFPDTLSNNLQMGMVSVSTGSRTGGKDFSTDGKDWNGAVPTSPSHPLYYSGEIGFLYGHATGKYGGDVKQTYFIGTVGDDNVQITVGGSYEDSNFNFPRRGRW